MSTNETTTRTETFDERVAREDAERVATKRAALAPLKYAADELYSKIGGTWTVKVTDEPNRDWPNRQEIEVIATQNIGGGFLPLTFRASYEEYKKRVIVVAVLPKGVEYRHTAHGLTTPTATYDPARGAAGFAATIKRIANETRVYVTGAVEHKTNEETHRSCVLTCGTRIAKALGTVLTTEHRDRAASNGDIRFGVYRTDTAEKASIGIDAVVYSDSATITVRSLPIDLAEKVLKFVNDNTKKGE